MAKVIGIDLGTSNSAAAIVSPNAAQRNPAFRMPTAGKLLARVAG